MCSWLQKHCQPCPGTCDEMLCCFVNWAGYYHHACQWKTKKVINFFNLLTPYLTLSSWQVMRINKLIRHGPDVQLHSHNWSKRVNSVRRFNILSLKLIRLKRKEDNNGNKVCSSQNKLTLSEHEKKIKKKPHWKEKPCTVNAWARHFLGRHASCNNFRNIVWQPK